MDLSVEELPSVLYFIFKVAQETGKIETNSCQFDATSNQLKELYFKFPLKPHEIEYNSSFLDDKFNFLQSLREKKCIGKEVWE